MVSGVFGSNSETCLSQYWRLLGTLVTVTGIVDGLESDHGLGDIVLVVRASVCVWGIPFQKDFIFSGSSDLLH